jgi:hypothetical protein
MALKDACGTLLVIAESRDRPFVAGGLDALGDLAAILVVLFGAGEVIVHGWSTHTIAVLAVICTVSFCGTAVWTRVGNRYLKESK